MINLDEIITCKSYHGLCDYIYDAPNIDDIPPTGLVHVPLDQIEHFFKRIEGNADKYVVVSSCSDYGLSLQKENPVWNDMLKWLRMQIGPNLEYDGIQMPPRVELGSCNILDEFSVKCHHWTRATFPSIPENVHHWFVANLMFTPEESRITAIPFGTAEGKESQLYEAIKNREDDSRKNKIYISWNDYTRDRYELREDMLKWEDSTGQDCLTVREPGQNQDSYEDYLKNLATHQYALSPPGNGADCYRTLESIYMGCFTFVEDTPTNYLTKLPVYRYRDIEDIIRYYNDDVGSQMVEGFEEIRPEIKLSYWKEMIHSKRNEMF